MMLCWSTPLLAVRVTVPLIAWGVKLTGLADPPPQLTLSRHKTAIPLSRTPRRGAQTRNTAKTAPSKQREPGVACGHFRKLAAAEFAIVKVPTKSASLS